VEVACLLWGEDLKRLGLSLQHERDEPIMQSSASAGHLHQHTASIRKIGRSVDQRERHELVNEAS